MLSDVKERILGSPDLYASQGRGIKASVNFITAHDGFTMMDLVSYNSKHNEANGEDNCDGENHNNILDRLRLPGRTHALQHGSVRIH